MNEAIEEKFFAFYCELRELEFKSELRFMVTCAAACNATPAEIEGLLRRKADSVIESRYKQIVEKSSRQGNAMHTMLIMMGVKEDMIAKMAREAAQDSVNGVLEELLQELKSVQKSVAVLKSLNNSIKESK
jgi:hypothetical protein